MTSPTMDALDYFVERLRQGGDLKCAALGNVTWTYRDLIMAAAEDQAALSAAGVQPGSVVVTAGAFDLRQLSLFVALARLSAVVVPLPEIGDEEVEKCVEIANATSVVTLAPGGSWSHRSTRLRVTNPLLERLIARGDPGLVVFTSGSTGDKKGILHSLRRLLTKFTVARRSFRTVSFLKWDHMGGINTVLHALSNHGMVAFPQGRSVEEVCALIRTHRIQLLPTTPSFLNLMLLSGADLPASLGSLELVTYGTEMMPQTTLARMREMFPELVMQQTYGLSELGVLRSKSLTSDSLFVKVGGDGFESRVDGGTLWIRADSAMEGYLNSPNPFSDDGWYDTGDRVDVQGEYVRFLGRASDVINVGGEKVLPAEVENFLLTLDNVADASVSGEANPVLGQIVVAVVALEHAEPADQAATRIKAACRQSLRRYMVPVKVQIVTALEYSDRFKKVRSRATTDAGPAR